jgi:ABC-2 type transport system permease protein
MSSPPARQTAFRAWQGKTAALILKESKQAVRDPSTWVVALLLPVLFLLFFGYAISFDADNLRLAIINESGGAHSVDLNLAFAQSSHFRVVSVTSRMEATRMLVASRVQGVLVISPLFDSLLQNGQSPPVQLLIDGTEPNTATFMRAYSDGVIANWQTARLAETGTRLVTPIGLEPVYWYNNTAKSRWALIPGSITIVMTLIGILLTSMVITREWERGTMEALFASSVSRMQIFLSKLIPYYVLAILSMAMCALAGHFLFGVPFRGSIPALFLLSSAFLMPSLGQGLLISSMFRSQLPAAIVSFLSGLMPALILSGLLFDIESMPRAVQYVTYLIPARYFNVSLKTLFLAGDVWPLLFVSMAYMLFLGALFFCLTYRHIVKRLDSGTP